MANDPVGFAEVAQAVAARWKAAGLDATIRGGIWAFQPPEKTARPFAIIEGLGDTPTVVTSKARYDDVVFTVELVADDLEVARPLVGRIRSVLGEDSLTLTTDNEAYLLKLLPGKVTYLQEVNYLRSIIEFTAKVKQARNR